jgi:hypothetical protein
MSKIEVNTVDVQCGSTLTLGSSGKTVQIACGASTVGMGRTGTVDWCTTAKTSPFTAVNGKGYFVNTTGGVITVTLPASPTAGNIVAFKDYGNTFDSNKLTVCRNGSLINGVAVNTNLTTESLSVTLIYVDGTKGWQSINSDTQNISGTPNYVSASGGTESTSGDYKIHTFTSDGTLTVSNAGLPAGSTKLSYLVVAGGGAGSTGEGNPNSYGGGGAGAGGFREGKCSSDPYTDSPLDSGTALTASTGSFPVTVGAGGAVRSYPNSSCRSPQPSMNGSNSVFSTITSTGGGGGGIGYGPHPDNSGADGGSGGGSGGTPPSNGGGGGSGNTPPVSPPQGQNGGTGVSDQNTSAGGGGGAGAVGSNGTPGSNAGNGGAGVTTSITGSAVAYAGGGGGGSGYPGGCGATAGTGGTGGGGTGNKSSPSTGGTAGTANTGGGGGGYGSAYDNANAKSGGAGGSGIVVIRYKYQN